MARDLEHAPYLPFEGGSFRLAMGLMPLPPAQWLDPGGDFADILAEKRALLAERHEEVFAALPEAEAAAGETLALLGKNLAQHHPTHLARDGATGVHDTAGEAPDQPCHPLEAAARLVAEDLCILQPRDEAYRLTAAVVCFPSRWSLAEKIGRPVELIHAPVPGYGERLERPVARFFASLRPERLAWRLNWTIVDDPAAFQPVRRALDWPITAIDAGDRQWLRVERQTLRKLPESGAVLFTIRTYITRLGAATSDAATAAELAGALRAMPEATRAYKHLADATPALLAWLDARATMTARDFEDRPI